MEILFLCKWNAYRSQIAEAFFNEYCNPRHKAKSAAIYKPLGRMHKLVVRAMKEEDIDILHNTSEKVTQEMIDYADKVILMSPDLINYAIDIPKEKIDVWDIPDKDIFEQEEHRYHEIVEGRDIIEEKVRSLIKTLI